ncbi:hypothetical protein C0Q70_02946 [Pomacea canaliculata]|uniref:Uncharacterized protein n=1 Tax=Pomacea canaliculata TaxID=400727 RepID=A0A2T7PRH6_POMCA|nr:hypothetical protein C0Q70_02946 [Pomacea canaliculata]
MFPVCITDEETGIHSKGNIRSFENNALTRGEACRQEWGKGDRKMTPIEKSKLGCSSSGRSLSTSSADRLRRVVVVVSPSPAVRNVFAPPAPSLMAADTLFSACADMRSEAVAPPCTCDGARAISWPRRKEDFLHGGA